MYCIIVATKNGRVSKHYASISNRDKVVVELKIYGFRVQSIETRRTKGKGNETMPDKVLERILRDTGMTSTDFRLIRAIA